MHDFLTEMKRRREHTKQRMPAMLVVICAMELSLYNCTLPVATNSLPVATNSLFADACRELSQGPRGTDNLEKSLELCRGPDIDRGYLQYDAPFEYNWRYTPVYYDLYTT